MSIRGLVLGIVTIEVTPPAKAALLNVLKFSLYSYPGSPTNAFISTIPGINILFLRSITSAVEDASVLLMSLPIDLIFPFSPIITDPFSSIF